MFALFYFPWKINNENGSHSVLKLFFSLAIARLFPPRSPASSPQYSVSLSTWVYLTLTLKNAEWLMLQPLLSPPREGVGRPQTSFRCVLNTILYVLITGCRWCDVPSGKRWAKRSTAHDWLGHWAQDGTLDRLRKGLLKMANLNGMIDWTRGSVDGSFSPGKGGRG